MQTVGNATGRILSQSHDKWGRWVSQTFQGSVGRTITMVSAYQVVTNIAKSGSTTAATQQYSLLVYDQQEPTKAPRVAFRRDLKHYLQTCRNRGDELIVVGDFNEAVGEELDGMLGVVQGLGLIDLMGARHGYELPATYARGRKCLDYGFATPVIGEALEACGYESFGNRFSSDHRAYFFDFDIGRLFGTQIQKLTKFEPRLLHSTNAKQVTSYLRRMHAIMTSCNAYARGKQLTNPGRRDAFADRLDSDVLNGSLVSERSLPVFHTPEWSKELAEARVRVSMFQKFLSCTNHGRPYPQTLLDQFPHLCPDTPIPSGKDVCQSHLAGARQIVKTIVEDSFSQRDLEFRSRIAKLESSDAPKDRAHARILRQMIGKERKKHMFRKLKQLRNSGGATGVTRIEVPVQADQDPKQCTEWSSVDIPSEVLAHLQTRNRKHFGQAHGTPFTVPPLFDDLGFCGDTPAADDILEGRYDYDKIQDPATRLLLQQLVQIQSLTDQSTCATISMEEFQSKLRVWRESTSTSPSGQHLGHFKYLLARH
jgi:hypothetical protein